MDDLFMDLECQGACASRTTREEDYFALSGMGQQVRWNQVAGLSLCASCQETWSHWTAGSGYAFSDRPKWVK